MEITKSRLRQIILEELGETNNDAPMMPALNPTDLKLAEMEERLESLEHRLSSLGSLEESQALNENVAAGIVQAIVKDAKLQEVLVNALIGPLTKKIAAGEPSLGLTAEHRRKR